MASSHFRGPEEPGSKSHFKMVPGRVSREWASGRVEASAFDHKRGGWPRVDLQGLSGRGRQGLVR